MNVEKALQEFEDRVKSECGVCPDNMLKESKDRLRPRLFEAQANEFLQRLHIDQEVIDLRGKLTSARSPTAAPVKISPVESALALYPNLTESQRVQIREQFPGDTCRAIKVVEAIDRMLAPPTTGRIAWK